MKVMFNTLVTPYRHNPYLTRTVSFKGFDCKEEDFAIKNLYGVPCASCGISTLRKDQIERFSKGIEGKTGAALISVLQKYNEHFHKTEKRVSNIICDLANKYPKENISELSLRYKKEHIDCIKPQQIKKLNDIKQKLLESSTLDKNTIEEFIDKYIQAIEGTNNRRFRKEGFEKDVARLVEKQYSIRKHVNKMANSMPEIKSEEDRFFKKYGELSQYDIAKKLVIPSQITCEHLDTKFNKGIDNTANYAGTCEQCNSHRNELPLYKWVVSRTDFKSNFVSYLEYVSQKIAQKELPVEYETYVDDVISTMNQKSKGMIHINPIENGKMLPKAKTKTFNFSRYLAQFKSDLEEQTKMLDELLALNKELLQDEKFVLLKSHHTQSIALKNVCTKRKAQSVNVQKQKSEIKRYNNKKEEYDRKKIRYGSMTPSSKEERELKEGLKEDLARLKKYLDNHNIEEMETRLNADVKKLVGLSVVKKRIETKLSDIEAKVETSAMLRAQISVINVDIMAIESLRKEVSELQTQNSLKPSIEAKIKELYLEIDRLYEANRKLPIPKDDDKDVLEYKKLQQRTYKIDKVLNDCKTRKRYLADEKNAFIFEYANKYIEIRLKELIEQKQSVEYQANLDEIEDIRYQILKLNKKLEAIEENKIKIAEKQEKLEKLGSPEQLTLKKQEAMEKLEKLDVYYKNFDLNNRIKTLDKAIKAKKAALEALESCSISQAEFMNMA